MVTWGLVGVRASTNFMIKRIGLYVHFNKDVDYSVDILDIRSAPA